MRLLERDPEAYEPEAEDIELDPFSPEAIAADAEAAQATGAPAIAKKGRAAIIGWDLGHNPAGRAIVLYDLLERDWDVELIGPGWSKFGGKGWPPIANSKRVIRTLVCDTLEEFYPAATAFAETHPYDRLPSMALGAMIKKNSACPMVLDIDDLELSFTDKTEPLDKETFSKDLVAALSEPYESLATRYCDNLIADCDALTVSNITLRQRYGGHMVRHARDETVFNASNFDREKAREKLGLKDSDFSLMFVGTPRPHKGIYQVAEALHELDDQDFVFTIVGNIDYPGMQEKLESFDKARIEFLPNCDFEELPQYLAAADAVPLLQDTTNEIAQYQIPAKISDATAFGLPVITTEVPPVHAVRKIMKNKRPKFEQGSKMSLDLM